MKHIFPLSFIQEAKDYVEERGMNIETACIVAGTSSNLNIFTSRQGAMRWSPPGMRDIRKDGGVFTTVDHAKEGLSSSLKIYKQDSLIYPDAQIHLVKELTNQ